MKVLLTKKFQKTDIEYIRDKLSDDIELIEPAEFTEEGVVSSITDAHVLLGGMLTESVLKASGHIKLFQIPWTGVDSINFELLKKYNIDCVCYSHSNASIVAEHAITLYGAVSKKIAYHDSQMRAGNWNRVSPKGNTVSPFSQAMFEKNIMLLGYGAVNRFVHSMLSGFKPRITVVNRSGGVKDIESTIEKVFPCADIMEAVPHADVIFVAVPLTEQTKLFFNKACFSAMKQNAILINVARGAVIDEESLYNVLHRKNIYGAGIDTWYNYPAQTGGSTFPSKKFPFHELENLVMSPHRAGYIDSGFPHLDDAILNLHNVQMGKPLLNRVSIDQLY